VRLIWCSPAHHIGRAGHALDAARDHHVGFAELHRARGVAGGFEARAAEAVHGRTRHFDGKTGKQGRHARHVAIVLARLVDAAIDHVVDRAPVDIGVTLDQRLDGMGRKIVDTHGAQATIVAADGGTNGVADEGFGHLGHSQHEFDQPG
jgi:hypothetical protein